MVANWHKKSQKVVKSIAYESYLLPVTSVPQIDFSVDN